MTRRTQLLLALLGFAIFCYWCIRMHAPMIQSDIGQRSSQALQAGSITGVDLTADGRDVLLRGAGAVDARERVAAVPGVRSVQVQALPSAAVPPADARSIPAARVEAQTRLDTLLAAKTVEFNQGSAILTKRGRAVLDEVAPLLKASPALLCEIQGHTDSLGNAERNRNLSYRRAVATRNYLLKEGIQPARLTAKAFGSAEPIASNDTPAGRRRNRRIHFLLKENPQ